MGRKRKGTGWGVLLAGVVALVTFAGCANCRRGMPEGHEDRPGAEGPAIVEEPQAPSTRVFVIEVAGTSESPTLGEYPVHLDVQATHGGEDWSLPLREEVESRLLESGLRLADDPAGAGYGLVLRAETRTELDLGAGRALVVGDADLALSRRDGGGTVRRAAFDAESGADASEADARHQVLAALSRRAVDEAVSAVRDRVSVTRVREAVVRGSGDRGDLRRIRRNLARGLASVPGVEAVEHREVARVLASGTDWSIHLRTRLGPGFEGDLADVLRSILEEDRSMAVARHEAGGAK